MAKRPYLGGVFQGNVPSTWKYARPAEPYLGGVFQGNVPSTWQYARPAKNQFFQTGWMDVEWKGKEVSDDIDFRINVEMLKLGRQIVDIAKRYTPVRTGHLQASEHFEFNYEDKTLVFISDVPYDIFVEYGTRNMRPQPHWRPAINTVGPVFGYNLEMSFANIPPIAAPILAAGAGFHLPSNLTAKQLAHVRRWMLPASKRHFIGNVSRTRMNIRRYL